MKIFDPDEYRKAQKDVKLSLESTGGLIFVAVCVAIMIVAVIFS